jgi:hypothetical protein
MFYAPSSTHGLDRRIGSVFSLCIAFLAVASSCGRKYIPEVEYPASYAEGAIFSVRDGAIAPRATGPSPVGDGLPAAIAPSIAAVAAVDGKSAYLAVNRIGLERLSIESASRKYKLERVGTNAEFLGRSVGGLFLRDSRVYCLLYRDPVFETIPPREPPALLLSLSTADKNPPLAPLDLGLGEAGKGLFAVFPLAKGTWMLQLRQAVPKGVESEFRSFDPATGAVSPLARSEFEQNLAPRPLSQAPESLRRAALLLAPEGYPVIVSASLPGGVRAAFSFGEGKTEDTVELRGAVTEAGAVLIAWNAVAAVAREGSQTAFRLPVPAPGAVYRDAVPLDGAILALWEIGVFPNIEESGAVLLPAP